MNTTLGRARALMNGFTPGQRAAVVVAALALLLGAVALTRWIAQPAYAPLYGNLSGSDANAIVEQLNGQGVPYELADGGRTVLVPQSQVYDLRIALSGQGLPAAESEGGYSLLDKQGITATDFQQNVAYRRALEGELGNTLEAMDGVRSAVVHLAIPKRDVFATETDKPTASVLLSVQPGVDLGRDQVRAITNLVAGSVESLDPGDVTVTDSAGRLLSVPTDGAGGSASAAGDADQQTAQFEDRMSNSVQDLLDRVLGPGRSAVRVNAQLNFDAGETTSERYVSETDAPPLAEATVSETFAGANPAAGGPLGQTFPTLEPAVGATGGGSYLREQRTVNNAVGKIVSRTEAAPGAVRRLTVAVAVDAAAAGAYDPNQIQQMVANAVGLDPTRGDSIQVDKVPFDTTAATAAAEELKAADAAEKTAGYIELGKKAGLGLLLAVVAFLALRRGKKDAAEIEALATDLPGGGVLVAAGSPVAIGAAGATALPSAAPALMPPDRMRDQVTELVDNQPEEVAQMLQGWLQERG